MNLINVPADFKNIQFVVNEEYEERKKISIYQMFEIIKLDERYEIQYNKLKNKCSMTLTLIIIF
ncbi:hypothetical protein C8C77_103214 [Halanaerobium saccharolyticum]|uniref:Uncharacterized protein n=1 Tax=Halanaerobium saccharolyticum TaxID=43595 RepID=A0A4R7Z6N0_9FIRM|nr:hypothetical protein [Halanaerobium saccharolyticum]RAK11226.1 hypothetical protein C7958_103214 [Halanaerobium saccharolyticum]TDW07077.1 hypothetical protein C8C77_103214 [Halanaerobium saccharolyticum]TDX63842.1 hypothetical protein C7956_102214 [Halanaerobium saccharolyticum]